MAADKQPQNAVEINAALLQGWPLPQPNPAGDKEDRGRVLMVGGAAQMPGTIMLAATAALRVGAGKVQVVTGASIAPLIAVSVPEIRVFAQPETAAGGLDPAAAEMMIKQAERADAVLIGPGLVDDAAIADLLRALLPRLGEQLVVLDAGALAGLRDAAHNLPAGSRIIITPHAGEMAKLLERDKATITRDPAQAAREAAELWGVTVVLKGAETWIATPDQQLYIHRGGSIGLATGGSGDTLAGILAGLAARGTTPEQAAGWAVFTLRLDSAWPSRLAHSAF